MNDEELIAQMLEALEGVLKWGEFKRGGMFTLRVGTDGEVYQRIVRAVEAAKEAK